MAQKGKPLQNCKTRISILIILKPANETLFVSVTHSVRDLNCDVIDRKVCVTYSSLNDVSALWHQRVLAICKFHF